MKKLRKIILMTCLVIFSLFITGCGCEKEMYTVTFDTTGGSHVTSQTIEKGKMVSVPKAPTRDGYIFSEWLLNGEKYDFSSKVEKDITLTASWATDNRATYTITFNSNGGSEVTSITVRDGDTASSPSDPKKEGYVFVGWYLGNEEYNFTNPVTKNITLNAKWEIVKENEYVVTFNSNGGSKVKSQKVTDGNKVIKPTNPTRTGYMFVNWQLDGEDYDFSSKVTENITLVAIWEAKEQYTVSFDTDGGNKIASIKVYENDKVTKPTNPTREGYNFVKWQLDGKDYDFNTKVTKNITLVAVWEAKEQYTVSFDTDGGNKIASIKVYENDKVTKPTNPTKEGYSFVKWQLNGKDYDFSSKVTGDITLKAVWEEITIAVTSVTLSKTSLNLNEDESQTLTATINPNNATNKTVEWTSSDENVVTIDKNGKVTAVGAGEATITATVDGKTATCTVTVAKKITYEIEYKEAQGTSLAQNYLFIKSSENKYVAGVIELTTINNDVIDVEVTVNGSKEAYVKTIIKSAKVKSVK